jgi:hypothetical protein
VGRCSIGGGEARSQIDFRLPVRPARIGIAIGPNWRYALVKVRGTSEPAGARED